MRCCATGWREAQPQAVDASDAQRRARGRPANAQANRSLERGLEILRAFRPGSEVLGNGELAERAGLARSTVSRLTQSLVEMGFLQYDAALRAYRLGVPVLSLAHAMRSGSTVLQQAAPLMRVARELAPRLMRLASDICDAVQTAQSEPL